MGNPLRSTRPPVAAIVRLGRAGVNGGIAPGNRLGEVGAASADSLKARTREANFSR